jgi:Zn-dependent peptidase ImmA (M78 family)
LTILANTLRRLWRLKRFFEVSSSFFALRRKKRTAHLSKFYRRRSRRFIHAKIVKEPLFLRGKNGRNMPKA